MPTQLFSTIRGKILAGSALLIVLGIALLTGLSVMGSYRHARDSAITESRQLAEQEAGSIQRILEQSDYSTMTMAMAI